MGITKDIDFFRGVIDVSTNKGQPILVRIEANLMWKVAQDTGANLWLGRCELLNLTVTADTFGELSNAMTESLDILFESLFKDGELESFLRKKGWTPQVQLPPKDTAVQFDVPFGINFDHDIEVDPEYENL